jgi:hypothetical protein
MLSEAQKFRGSVYLEDGAILPEELTVDGRHSQAVDDVSWHVLLRSQTGRVCGCLRVFDETQAHGFEDLAISKSTVARCSNWGPSVRKAVETEMATARRQGLSFAEVGGWAIAPERRCTLDALRIILATYGLLELLGGFMGLATATCRHCSAAVLRRIGLSSLATDSREVPSYYDPQYRCEMEILRFDSRLPNPKYLAWVREFRSQLRGVPVIAAEASGAPWAHKPIEPALLSAAVANSGSRLRMA